MSNQYYDGTKLLSLKDVDGNKPEIYMCTTNRTGGKTTYFSRLLVNNFLKKGEKFALLYRYNYEMGDCADKFFKDIRTLFFPQFIMKSRPRAKGVYAELFLIGDDEKEIPCGYALSLNNADAIKRYSHLFSDIKRIMFDEFQSETNHYCPDEIRKFMSVHTSIARGQGEQSRYVPVYMLSNPVSIINPYYTELGISERLSNEVRFLRGHGFVLEQGYVESASRALKESGFSKAFSANKYTAYAAECVYLNDSTAFIEKPTGSSRYLATFKYEGREYGVKEYPEMGIIFCDDKPDVTYKHKISVTTDDHQINYVMLQRNDLFISQLRWYFEKGCFRFKNLSCKEAILKALSY